MEERVRWLKTGEYGTVLEDEVSKDSCLVRLDRRLFGDTEKEIPYEELRATAIPVEVRLMAGIDIS